MLELISRNLADPAFLWVLAAVFAGGVVRGFSGFGTGMIIGPVAAALFSPQIAIAMIIVIDLLPMLPLLARSVGKADWQRIVPLALGHAALLPAGIYILKHVDPVIIRWLIAFVILVAVALLWSGWRYHGSRPTGLSAAIGGLSGFLGGSCGMSGPPVILYWMAGSEAPALIRANLIVFLFLSTSMIGAGLVSGGMFGLDSLARGIAAAPVYMAGLYAGSRMFGLASEETYRRIAYGVILVAGITSLPLFDAWLR